MNDVLVTGGAGFIGRVLVKHLEAENVKVRVMTRNIEKAKKILPSANFIQADLTLAETLPAAVSNIDTIFHFAGYAHDTNDDAIAAQKHYDINYLGSSNLFQAALNAGVKKFIFISSSKAVADSEKKIDEHFNEMPQSPYGLAKHDAEQMILTEGKKANMHVAILRPCLVYGEHWQGNLARMLRMIDRGIFPPLPQIAAKRSMVSTFDVARAACLLANKMEANGNVYFVTDGIDYSSREIYLAMASALQKQIPKWQVPYAVLKFLAQVGDALSILHKKFPLTTFSLEKLMGSALYDSAKIQHELGFKPTQTLYSYLPKIVASYRAENQGNDLCYG